MDLLAIVFTVCALAHPDQCEEQRIEYVWHGSLRECAQGAQPILRSGSANIRTGISGNTTAKPLTRKRRRNRADQRARRDAFRAAAKTRAGFCLLERRQSQSENSIFLRCRQACSEARSSRRRAVQPASAYNAHSLERDRSGFNQLATSRHFRWWRTGAGFRNDP